MDFGFNYKLENSSGSNYEFSGAELYEIVIPKIYNMNSDIARFTLYATVDNVDKEILPYD